METGHGSQLSMAQGCGARSNDAERATEGLIHPQLDVCLN